MPLSMEVCLGPGDFVFDGEPATPRKRDTYPTQFLVHVYCGQTAGWMKTPLGTEVDLGPGEVVLEGVPALRETCTAAPIFSAHVYCGHGRPSQVQTPPRKNGCCPLSHFASTLWHKVSPPGPSESPHTTAQFSLITDHCYQK